MTCQTPGDKAADTGVFFFLLAVVSGEGAPFIQTFLTQGQGRHLN